MLSIIVLIRNTRPSALKYLQSLAQTLLAVSTIDRSIGLVRGVSNYVDCFPQHVIAPPVSLRSFEDVISFSDYVAHAHGLTYVQNQEMQQIHARRMDVVQAAYGVFRQKWDPAMPPQYSGVDAIDFARLRDIPPLVAGEYQPPVPVAPPLAEFL